MESAGVPQAPYAADLREYLDSWLWRAARTRQVSFLDNLHERFPGLPPAARRRIDDFVRYGLAEPWTLPDAGGDVLRLGNRMYHVGLAGSWVSYLESERTRHGLSNYQFADPVEWFAEAYAARYDTADAPRQRLNPAVREWFYDELPRLLDRISGKPGPSSSKVPEAVTSSPAGPGPAPEPEWLRTALDRHLHRPAEDAPNLVTNAATTARVPKALVDAAGERPDLWVYFHEAKRGAVLGKLDRSVIHERLEQFAQAGVRPLVFTPGRPSLDVLSVLDTYRATLLNEVPAGLGTAWKATTRSRTDAIIQSPEITAGLLDWAVAASGAAPQFNRVSESFGSLVWASTGVREQHRRIASEPAEYRTAENLRAADEMAARMPDSAMAHLVKPLLEFGPVSDVVPRFVEAAREGRPSVLMGELRRLEASGQPVEETRKGSSTGGLVSLVEATGKGVVDPATLGEIRFTTGVLKTLDAISAGQWDDAQTFVTEHKGMTDPGHKIEWARLIGERLETSPIRPSALDCRT
ncbi:hypothetical protein [Micromonospora okii]|uniref:hypothetical protein n=1 Tax=Micromonospora okii TaxID=1182970 RepID=UPI001E32BD8A|nr:hypothetical protein [Micromonospora okii]